ncbi:AAA family ATPase (plasmid) [Cetobacterium somerae]|uniref:AAA family ATPase n=1 Tax=Cetobacterium somerae TaxID=188913 RepID=UPI0038912612
MKSVTRLKSISIKNIKNVKNGSIELPQSIDESGYVKQSDIIGIYGQNGSGKTAVIESLNILKILISGEKLPKDTINLISADAVSADLEYEFYAFIKDKLSLIKYKVTLEKSTVKR